MDEISCVSFFRGLTPTDVLRRFGPSNARGEEMSVEDLEDVADEFALETGGADGGGHVGVIQANGWSVALEPMGWYAVLEEYYTDLSRGCEMVAVSRHDFADDSFVYAVDGKAITEFDPRWPPRRWGSDPDRLNPAMRKVGLPTDAVDDGEREAVLDRLYDSRVEYSLALAAEITGVPLTRDLWRLPFLVGLVDQRFDQPTPSRRATWPSRLPRSTGSSTPPTP